MRTCCVIIPVYKKYPSKFELISLTQCIKVLNNHQIAIICSHDLDISYYIKLFKKKCCELKIYKFYSQYFKSISGYNKLMLSPYFYNRFIYYNYILIYQLDAFVFRDDIDLFCSLGYDYFGSPWFKNFDKQYISDKIWYVGNGGLSLRKVSTFNDILSRNKIKISFFVLLKYYIKNSAYSKLYLAFFRCLGFRNNKKFYLNGYYNEDAFWSFIATNIKNPIKSIPLFESLKFSFDGNPSIAYKYNNYKLPFGCHAWYNYGKSNLEFWKPFIQNEGYDL